MQYTASRGPVPMDRYNTHNLLPPGGRYFHPSAGMMYMDPNQMGMQAPQIVIVNQMSEQVYPMYHHQVAMSMHQHQPFSAPPSPSYMPGRPYEVVYPV